MRPQEILGSVKGLIRDVAIDALPEGYVWDLINYIPNRKGSKVDLRGGWKYFGPAYTGNIWGGRDCRFTNGDYLLVCAGSQIHSIDLNGSHTSVGPGPSTMVQNAVKLRDRAYFMDGQGITPPTAVFPVAGGGAGLSAPVVLPGSAPNAKVGLVYKDRLVLAGAPLKPANVYFSQTEDNGGPLAAWDPLSYQATSEVVTGLAAMQNQILVFHTGMIERIRGAKPTSQFVDTDFIIDTLTDQVGCTIPATIVPWRENVIWADERGVFVTDGSTVKNLAEQGGISDFWREAYRYRIDGASINAGVYLDYLCISILTTVNAEPFFLICDLNERTWFRFNNTYCGCQIPGEGSKEETYMGMYNSNRIARVSEMFGEPLAGIIPPPDSQDDDGKLVYGSITTGFQKLTEEGQKRIREIHVSYHHQSYTHFDLEDSLEVEYRLSPPTAQEIRITNTDGLFSAGKMPATSVYSRKKVQVGKRAYGIMVRISGRKGSRVSRLFSIGVKSQAQDRGKVTT